MSLHTFTKTDEFEKVIRVNWEERRRGKSADPLTEPMTIKCMHCDWEWSAPAQEVMDLHRAHRAHEHSGEAAATSSRPKRGGMNFMKEAREKRGDRTSKRKEETIATRDKLVALIRERDMHTAELAEAVGVSPSEKVSTILVWAMKKGEVPGLWKYRGATPVPTGKVMRLPIFWSLKQPDDPDE